MAKGLLFAPNSLYFADLVEQSLLLLVHLLLDVLLPLLKYFIFHLIILLELLPFFFQLLRRRVFLREMELLLYQQLLVISELLDLVLILCVFISAFINQLNLIHQVLQAMEIHLAQLFVLLLQ